MASIVILTGSPGTGKTTVAAELARAKPRGVHIPSDVFYTFPAHPLSPYRSPALEQNGDVIAAATRAAMTFAGRRHDVVLDGIFSPRFLPVVAAELRSTDILVHYVVLQAPLEIALRRVRDRIGREKDHVVRLMHTVFSDLGPYAAHAVDTGSCDAASVARQLESLLDRGEFVLDRDQVLSANARPGRPQMGLQIADLRADRPDWIEQAAALLHDAFRDRSRDWQTLDSARHEAVESSTGDRISRVALDESGRVVGWIGAISGYRGNVWEIHPLVVAAPRRRRGIGRALVQDLEDIVGLKGAATLWAGSDDEDGATSLSGVNLYADLPGAIRSIRNLGGHPYEFFVRLGFTIAGVVPDANGSGKPDILLAKCVQSPNRSISGARRPA